MERVIDRSCYRRNTNQVKPNIQVDLDNKYVKKFLIQLLVSVTLILIIATLKLVKEQTILPWIKKEIKKEMTISTFIEDGQKGIKNMLAYVEKIIKEEETTIKNQQEKTDIENNIKNNSNQSLNISSLSTNEPFEKIYEEDVEGINQMSEDAKYIKENYKFKIPLNGTITSAFGVRDSDNPIVSSYHTGTDIAANEGTAIIAALSGEVIKATTDVAYGKHIIIQTDNVKTLYAHCSKLNVKVGQKINQGEIIGYVGSTGFATGPHLHFEIIYNDRFVNPQDVLNLK